MTELVVKKLHEVVAELKKISNSKARRLVEQGAVSIFGFKLKDGNAEFNICKRGKPYEIYIGKSRHTINVISDTMMLDYLGSHIVGLDLDNKFEYGEMSLREIVIESMNIDWRKLD